MRVEHHEERGVHDAAPLRVRLADRLAGETQAEAARDGIGPVVLRHLLAVAADPRQVLNLRALNRPAEEELAAPEHRMPAPQPGDEAGEGQQVTRRAVE